MKSLVGDGKVGHGTIRDGKLILSDKDVAAIVDAQRNSDFSLDDEMLNGADRHAFRLVADEADNDVPSSEYFAGMPEIEAITFLGIETESLRYDAGFINAEEPAVKVNPSKLIQDYKAALGVDLDEDSAKRLATRIERRMNAEIASEFDKTIRDNQDELYDRWRERRDTNNYRQSGR